MVVVAVVGRRRDLALSPPTLMACWLAGLINPLYLWPSFKPVLPYL